MLHPVGKFKGTLQMKPEKEHQMSLNVSRGTFNPFKGPVYSSYAVRY